MKEYITANILSNDKISNGIFDMRLNAPFLAETSKAGQFVQIYVNDGGHILPRPISICAADNKSGSVRFVYKVVGWGTDWLSAQAPGTAIRILGPLGNGFNLAKDNCQAVVAGGIGLPPVLMLCKEIRKHNPDCQLTAYLGFQSETFLMQDFAALGVDVKVATDNGSTGFHGNVIQLLTADSQKPNQFYGCGPHGMLQALSDYAAAQNIPCQVSLEERMACGFGACVGCVTKIKLPNNGWAYKEVCKHGPVFNSKEVVWHD